MTPSTAGPRRRHIVATAMLCLGGWAFDAAAPAWLAESGLGFGATAGAIAALALGPVAGALVAGLVAAARLPVLGPLWSLEVVAAVWLGLLVRRRIPSLAALLVYWSSVGVVVLAIERVGSDALAIPWYSTLSAPLSGLIGLAAAEVALASGRLRALIGAREPYHQKRPLRALLLHGFVLLGALPALILSAHLGGSLAREVKGDAQGHLDANVQRVNVSLDRFLADHRHSLRVLASECSGVADPGQLASRLDHHRRLFPGFLTMIVADAQGHVVAASPSRDAAGAPLALEGVSIADRTYFRATRDRNEAHLSDAFLGRGFGADPIVAVTAPLQTTSGHFDGLVEGSLDLRVLRELVVAETARRDDEFMILDASSAVVATSASSAVPLLTRLPRLSGPAPKSDPEYLSATATNRFGWRSLARRRLEDVEREGDRLRFGSLAIALLTLGGSLALAVLSMATVARPLEALARAVSTLDVEHDSPNATLPQTPAREIDRLGHSIEDMRTRLRSSYSRLGEALEAGASANLQLKQLVEVMDRKVQERTAELAEENERAERLGKAQMEFLAHMSHEIRTPLNSVIGLTELLVHTPLSPSQREYANTIRESGEVLLAVVNDILDLSKIEQGKVELEPRPFDLEMLVEETTRLVAVRAASKDLEVFCDLGEGVPRWLATDPVRLRQVFLNLIGNAVRLTERGEVEVRVALDSRPEMLRVAIRDTGPGIPPDLRVRLYLPYSQLGQAAPGSTGLGLAISRALVERLGGELWVDGGGGPGSCFRFTFKAPTTAAQSPGFEVPHLLGLTVLVVVRNAALRQSLAQRLRQWGAHTQSAATVAGAEAAVAQSPATFALTDLDLDDGTALDVVRRLVPEGRLRSAVLLVPIGRAVPQAIAERFCATVTKPARSRDLARALAVALNETAVAPEGPTRTLLVLAESAVDRRLLRNLASRAGWQVEAPDSWDDAVIGAPSVGAVLLDFDSANALDHELRRAAALAPAAVRIACHAADRPAPPEAHHSLPKPRDPAALLALLTTLRGSPERTSNG